MATYDNKHWLLSHIRNSFISTDDTGMCEAVMLSDDLPSTFAARTKYAVYPGLDLSDDESGMEPLSTSYDIQMDQGMSFIQRSNTAQKLDKMNLARKRAAKIKNVKCDDQNIAAPSIGDAEADALFVRKTVVSATTATIAAGRSTQLRDHLQNYPKQPENKFLQYSRFDGTSQMSVGTKKMKIFLTMLPLPQRNYPMTVCVLATAKIQEFIGLICYKIILANPDLQLLSVRNYGLYITEEDGEIDMDFPPLEPREPCSKFCFSHLALVERVPDAARTMSFTSEIEAVKETLLEETLAANAQQSEDLARMLGHTNMMEAPLYRSYRLKILIKGFIKSDIQLGISAEKLEIDPVQQQNAKFWTHQKAISHSMDAVLSCEFVDRISSDPIIRILYYQAKGGGDDSSTAAASASATSGSGSSIVGSPSGGAGSGGGGFDSIRSYFFVTDRRTAEEIIMKIRNIIEVRSSEARREFMTTLTTSAEKKKKKFKKLFTSSKSSGALK